MSDPLSDTSLSIDPANARPDGEHAALKADNASLMRELAEARALLSDVYYRFHVDSGCPPYKWRGLWQRIEAAVRPELYREPQTAPQGQQRPAKARDGETRTETGQGAKGAARGKCGRPAALTIEGVCTGTERNEASKSGFADFATSEAYGDAWKLSLTTWSGEVIPIRCGERVRITVEVDTGAGGR